MIPTDDIMLVSYLNTKLRDEFSTLGDFCDDAELDLDELLTRLRAAGFRYEAAENRIIPKN